MGGTQDNGTLRRDSNGSWDQVALGDGGACDIVESGAPRCYHSYYAMPIERAFFNPAIGLRWKDVSPPVPKRYPSAFYPPMQASNELLAKAGSTLWISENSGDDWDEVNFEDVLTKVKASIIRFVSPTTVLVGTNLGTLYRITRRPTGWKAANTTQLSSPSPGAYFTDIALGNVRTTLWASSNQNGRGRVFVSKDSGDSWSDCSANLPRIPVNALVSDSKNPETLFAATDHGVYQTIDAGQSWRFFSNGLPRVVVSDLHLHEASRLLRAGTKSRGLWQVLV
jgi:hypothetical protein